MRLTPSVCSSIQAIIKLDHYTIHNKKLEQFLYPFVNTDTSWSNTMTKKEKEMKKEVQQCKQYT